MYGHWRVVECLCVGVAKYEGDIVDAFAVHVVDGVAATATNTDDFDNAVLLLRLTEVEDI